MIDMQENIFCEQQSIVMKYGFLAVRVKYGNQNVYNT